MAIPFQRTAFLCVGDDDNGALQVGGDLLQTLHGGVHQRIVVHPAAREHRPWIKIDDIRFGLANEASQEPERLLIDDLAPPIVW